MSMRTAESSEYVPDVVAGEGAAEPGQDSYSLIDRNSIFDGTFTTSRDLRVEGEVKGTIDCNGTLFVAQGATVSAKVEAENITVAGDLNGDIRCQGRLHIMPSGRIRGKVSTLTLVINEGAYYEGQLEMTPPEERGQVAPPRQLSPVSAPVTMPTTAAPARAAAGPRRRPRNRRRPAPSSAGSAARKRPGKTAPRARARASPKTGKKPRSQGQNPIPSSRTRSATSGRVRCVVAASAPPAAWSAVLYSAAKSAILCFPSERQPLRRRTTPTFAANCAASWSRRRTGGSMHR